MDESLILKIRDYVIHQGKPLRFPPASEGDVEDTERELGFSIPTLLKCCYLKIGNGGFGPGYGIIGVKGGRASDHGTLAEIYRLFQHDQAAEGQEWKAGLLPFCSWGCNIFSCVDCSEPKHVVHLYEAGEAWSQNYTLYQFFEMWIAGVDLLSTELTNTELVEREIINPFTRKKYRVTARRRKK
jgi:hypothetical protein